jgi:hypothetical protein
MTTNNPRMADGQQELTTGRQSKITYNCDRKYSLKLTIVKKNPDKTNSYGS